MANEMNPTEWGWKKESDELIPIMTDNNAAPDELKVIHDCENCDNPNNTQEVDTEEEEEDDTQN